MADTIINTGNVLPEYEKKKSWETTTPGVKTTTPGDESTTETPSESPERLQAEKGMDASANAEIDASERQRALDTAKAKLNAQAATEASDLAGHQAADRAAAQGIADAEISKARDYHARKQAELDKTPDVSLWGGARHPVLNGIAMALGGIGDAIQRAAMVRIGKAPPTIDTVGDIINAELNRQRDHISRLKDSVVTARTGIADAMEARQQMLQDVDHNGVEMYKRLEGIAKARLAAQGATAADIEGDQRVAAIRSKRAEHQSAYVAPLIQRVTKKTEGVTTTAEGPTRKAGGEEIKRAPTAGGGKSPTGATAEQSAALAKYVDEHPNASQGDLVGVAKNLGIPDAQGEVTRVAGTNSLPEKERERETVDLEGKPVLAPSARNVTAVSEQVADTQRALKAIDDLKSSLAEPGLVPNAIKAKVPGTDINTRKEEVVGLMSKALGLPMSDARQKLDEHIVGTGGVGLLGGDAIKNLDRLKEQIHDYGATKVKGTTTPVRAPEKKPEAPRVIQGTQEPTPKTSQVDEAKAWLVSAEAKANPAKRKAVYDKLKSMGVRF